MSNSDDYFRQMAQEQADKVAEAIKDNSNRITVLFGRKFVPKNVRWAMIFQDFFEHLAGDKRLKRSEFVVLSYLISTSDFENYAMISQREIAEKTKMKQQDVAKSLKILKDCEYISIRKAGRNNVYRVNPNMMWKGRYKNRNVIDFPKSN